jgi:anti-sigma B factor antagonist
MEQATNAQERPRVRSLRTVRVEQIGDVWLARFQNSSLDDEWVQTLGDEVGQLIEREGARKVVFQFGDLNCLFSVLLGKLISLNKLIESKGGRLKLANVSPEVREVFQVCHVEDQFRFAPSMQSAINDW